MVQLAFLIPFLLCVQVHVFARPSRTVPYFPQYNPWNIGDIGIHAEESRWRPYNYPDETYPQFSKYIYSIDPSDKELKDRASIRDDIQLSLPVYEKGKGGFVPPSLSALSKVYWWEKRFNNFDIPPSEDLPYGDEDATDNELESSLEGSLKKRDYTAAQLVNMLKALAKARRQRQIRIAGKGLRFGISR